MNVGWPILGDFAIPGDPWQLRALAGRIASSSQALDTVRRSLAEQSLHGTWSGGASVQYNATGADCADGLLNLGAALGEADYVLAKFISAVEEAQLAAGRIASELQDCESELQAVEAQVQSAHQGVTQARAARDAATAPDERQAREQALTAAAAVLRRSQSAADDAGARRAQLLDLARQNRERYDAAVGALCSALEGAHTYAPPSPKKSRGFHFRVEPHLTELGHPPDGETPLEMPDF